MEILFRVKIFLLLMGLFWVFIYLIDRFYDLESRGISLSPGFIMWRTETGVGFLDRVSKKFKKFWSGYGVLCAALGIIVMLVFFYVFALGTIEGTFRLLTPAEDLQIPSGAKKVPVPIPGVNIPFLLGIISLGTALLIHEPAHGILFRRLKFKIKSVGLAIFLFVIPGAFVEEDEEEFEKASPWERIRAASAGPVSNIFLGVLCFGLVMILVNPLPGLYISEVVPNSAAENAGLTPGAQLSSVNGTEIDNYEMFDNFMGGTKPGQSLTIETDENQYFVTLGEHPSENIGYLGVRTTWSYFGWADVNPMVLPSVALFEVIGHPVINKYAYRSLVPWDFIRVLKWIFALNILVGIFNLLPLKPLDGGHVIEGISEKFTSKSKAKTFTKVISFVTLVFIILNFLIIYA